MAEPPGPPGPLFLKGSNTMKLPSVMVPHCLERQTHTHLVPAWHLSGRGWCSHFLLPGDLMNPQPKGPLPRSEMSAWQPHSFG